MPPTSPTEPPKSESPAPRPQRGLVVGAMMFGLALILLMGAQDGIAGFGPKRVDVTEFYDLLKQNAVKTVVFKDNQADVTLRPGDLGKEREAKFTVNFNSKETVRDVQNQIREWKAERGIETTFSNEEVSTFLAQLIAWLLPTLLLIGAIYFFLFRQLRGPGGPGSLMNFGKSRHKVVNDKVKVTLKDVAGVEEARQDIEEIIAFLKDPTRFSRLGGRMPKGVLLVGPPGTGKTLLAKATAGEAGVPFYSVSGSDFVEMFVGVGASRVRDLFEKAKETSPCIIFLDEVDAVGRRRGGGMGGGGHDEREQTLNQILVEMDGFDTDRGIIIMAATNRPDILDPALLRPGRFDRQIVIGMPSVEARAQILGVHARDKVLAPDVDLNRVARATPTFSGAELEALLNEAALSAAVKGQDEIYMVDMEEARDRIRFGRAKKSWTMVEEEVRATAYHEAGHALVAALIPGCDPLHKVTVVPRGRALGMTMSLPDKDQLSLSKKQILARICMAFGGRIGEAIYTDDLSTGAGNDIQQATNLARRMVTEWGMSERLGPVKFASDEGDGMFLGAQMGRVREFSEETMRQVDEEVRRIMDEEHRRAEDLINERKDALERIADALLKFETISGEEVSQLIDGQELDRIPVDHSPKPDGEGDGGDAPPAPSDSAEGTDEAPAGEPASASSGESASKGAEGAEPSAKPDSEPETADAEPATLPAASLPSEGAAAEGGASPEPGADPSEAAPGAVSPTFDARPNGPA